MKSPWKLIILLAGIFLAGAGSGALVTMRVWHRPPSNQLPPSAELWSSKHMKRIIEELELQPAQVEKIRPVVDGRMVELFNLRARYLDNNHALREVMEREVAEYMTPEQRAKYEKMNREFHERTRRQERGERPPPGPERPRDK
jgi:hypothetical protein